MDGNTVRLVSPVASEQLLIDELVAGGDKISIAIRAEMTTGEGKCSAATLSEWRREHIRTRRSTA